MRRFLSWLNILGLVLGVSACDQKDGVPLPKTGTGEIRQKANVVAGRLESAAVAEKGVRETKAKITGAAPRLVGRE